MLEDRRMLTVITSTVNVPATFTFQQSPDPAEFGSRPARVWGQVTQTGNTISELVGATIDSTNNIILTDIPGQLNGVDVLGGIGGYNGGTLIGAINITDPFPSANGTQNGTIGTDPAGATLTTQNNTVSNVAASPNGTLASVNVTANGRVEVMNFPTLVADGKGNVAAPVQVRINEATLNDDRLTTLVYPAGMTAPASVTDVAMDPDPAAPIMYVLGTDAGGFNTLTVVDVDTNTVLAQSQLASDPAVPGMAARLSGSNAMAFRTVGAGRELWIFTPDYDGNNTKDANGIGTPAASGTTTVNPNYDPALVRINIDDILDPVTFGQWPKSNGAGDPGLSNIVSAADQFKRPLDGFNAMTWDPFDNGANGEFIVSFQNPDSTGTGTGSQAPPWDIYALPLAAGNLSPYTDFGAIGLASGAGGGGGTGGTAGSGIEVHGLALARDARNNIILTAMLQIPQTVGAKLGQIVQVATLSGNGRFLPLNASASAALGRPGTVILGTGLASWPVSTNRVGPVTRPFLYGYDGDQVVRGSSICLPVAPDTGRSQVSLVEGAAFNPVDANRLYFVPTLGAVTGGGGGGGTAAQLLCSIDLDPALFDDPTFHNSTDIQNGLLVGGAFAGKDGKNQDVHVAGIAFDQTDPVTAVLHAINGNNGNVSGGVNVLAGQNTITLARPGFSGIIPQILGANMGKAAGLVFIGGGVISRGGLIAGIAAEDPAAVETFAWTTTPVNGHVQLVRIDLTTNPATAIPWGAVDPDIEVGGLTFDANRIDPVTLQLGSLIATNPGIVNSGSQQRDTIFNIDPRYRPNECNIFQDYFSTSDSASMQSVYEVQLPPAPQLPIPYNGDVGAIRVVPAQGGNPITVTPNGGTGQMYMGARTRDLDPRNPYDDLWPVTGTTLLDADGVTPSAIGFGLVPLGNGQIISGMRVGLTGTGAPQNFGRFLFSGALTGQVNISGSVDYFYTGWLLTGDPNTPSFNGNSKGGAVAGLPAGYQPYSNTDHAGDFVTGGDLRNLVTLDTINSVGGYTSLNTITYLTRGKFQIGGRLGEIDGREDLVGTVDVANTPNIATAMPLTQQINEVEFQTNGAANNINAAFVAGNQAQPAFFNETFATAQYVGAVNTVRGNNVIDIAGTIQPKPTTKDDNDYYAVSLMAGQVVRLSIDNGGLILELIDPDGRVVSTNVSGTAPIATATMQWTTDRPGLWRIHVAAPYTFNAAGAIVVPNHPLPLPYNILMTSAPMDTYGMNIALGAVHMTGNIFDGAGGGGGTSFYARNGDIGALVSGATLAVTSVPALAPDVLLDEDTYEASGQPPQNALIGAAINVTLGNLRTVQGAAVGVTCTDAFAGSVGLLSATGGDLVFNSSFAIPRSNDQDLVGTARQAAIGGDYQRVQATGNIAAQLMANRGIGVITGATVGGLDTEPTGFFVVNADEIGRDGTIDLIDTTGDFGTPLGGGSPIITGPGGNVRYMHVGGNLHRDYLAFGGGNETDDATLYGPGESIPFNDDSGTPMLIQPVATVPGGLPSITLRAYGIRGSGGSAVVSISSTDSVTISAQGISPLASVEIGQIIVNGAGTAVGPNAAGTFVAPPAAFPRLSVNIGGTAPVDVYDLRGGNFYQIQNNSKAVDSKRNAVAYGEIVNITAGSIYNLTAANIGVAKQSTNQPIIGEVARLNAFPFLGQTNGVLAGNIGYITTLGALGNISSSGTIGQITADSDNKTTPGALTGLVRAPLEGIVGPVVSAGGLNNVVVGRGMTTSGNSPSFSWGGLYSNGPIRNVTADAADIYGDIVSTTSIGTINVRNNGSLIWSDIGVPTTLNGMQKNSGTDAVVNVPNPITDRTRFTMGTISVQGAMALRGKPAPKTGGIIGCVFAAGAIGTIQVTRGFGIIDSVLAVASQNGTINTISSDGYGLRDVTFGNGTIVGKVIVTGNGQQIPSTGFSASLRKSETMDSDPYTHFQPNYATDLHRYLGTTAASPIIANDNNRAGITRSGVIAGAQIFANRDLTLLQAWRTTFSTQLGAYIPTSLHFSNSIKTVQVAESMIDPQITTGRLDLLSVGKDLHSPNIHVAGLFSTLSIGGNYTIDPASRTDVIEAIGANGSIKKVTIGGRMDGNIKASVSIGPHKVGNKTGTGKFYVNGKQIA